MIFEFLKKQREIKEKRELTKIMITNLNISEEQKSLYIKAIDILDNQWMDLLYKELTRFIENFELKEIEDIKSNNFSRIAWMRKKEANLKKKELNAFQFLINNL